MIYELGIPVVDSGLPWHVDIGQKVPLSFERDNVTPAYLARLRAVVLELMHARIDTESANASMGEGCHRASRRGLDGRNREESARPEVRGATCKF